jgi:hypothetical protein
MGDLPATGAVVDSLAIDSKEGGNLAGFQDAIVCIGGRIGGPVHDSKLPDSLSNYLTVSEAPLICCRYREIRRN